MVDVITSHKTDHLAAVVAAFSSHQENAALWYANIKSVKGYQKVKSIVEHMP